MFLGFTKSAPATQAQRPEGRASAWCEARIAKGRKERFHEIVTSGADLSATSPILRLRNMLTLRRQAMDGRHHACRIAGAIVIAWNQWLRGHRKGSLEWAHVVKLPDPL